MTPQYYVPAERPVGGLKESGVSLWLEGQRFNPQTLPSEENKLHWEESCKYTNNQLKKLQLRWLKMQSASNLLSILRLLLIAIYFSSGLRRRRVFNRNTELTRPLLPLGYFVVSSRPNVHFFFPCIKKTPRVPGWRGAAFIFLPCEGHNQQTPVTSNCVVICIA